MTHESFRAWRVPSTVLTVIIIGLWFSSQAPAQVEASPPNCPENADLWVIQKGHYIWHSWAYFSDRSEPYGQFEARAAEMNGYDSPRPFWSLPAGAIMCIPDVPGYAYVAGSTPLVASEIDSLQEVITMLEGEIDHLSDVAAYSQKELAAATGDNFPWWILPTLLLLAAVAYIFYQRHAHQIAAGEHEKKQNKLEKKLKSCGRLTALMTNDGRFSAPEVAAMVEVAKHYRFRVDLPDDVLHDRGFVYVLEYPFTSSAELQVIIPGASQLVKGKNSKRYILKSDQSRQSYGIPKLEKIATV